MRFYNEWVRDHVGRWEYRRHVPVAPAANADRLPPTREFAVTDQRATLGGEPVKLWGLRCNNALLNPALVSPAFAAISSCRPANEPGSEMSYSMRRDGSAAVIASK